MPDFAVSLRSASFAYADAPVLQDINLNLATGTLHGIVGPNGSGKSTLLDLLAGNLAPLSGTVMLAGRDARTLPRREHALLAGLAPQEFAFNFPFTVRETVLMGRHPHIPRFSGPSDQDTEAVNNAMRVMDVAHLANRPLTDLSGGERQRTVLARTLAQDTPLLLLDEPTSSMDVRHALACLEHMRDLCRNKGKTVIAVLHDLNLAATFCAEITMLSHGRIHAQGPAGTVLTPDAIRKVFCVEARVGHSTFTNAPNLEYRRIHD